MIDNQDLFDVAENGVQVDLGDVVSRPRTVKRIFYHDPGHGWLAVKIAELHELGIHDKITRYSYRKGGTAYLEEDCDAQTYVDALKARGIKVECDERHQDPTPIRNYQPF